MVVGNRTLTETTAVGTGAELRQHPIESGGPIPRTPLSLGADIATRGLLLIVGVVLPAVAAGLAGSLGLPQNDDWAYRRVAQYFASTGHLRFTGWSSPTLVGQVFWSWPFLRVFGDHGWVFGASTAVLAGIGIMSAFYLARKILTPPLAIAAVLLVIVVPGFAMDSSTFMTDVPALSAELACIAVGFLALSREGRSRWLLLATSMSVGVFAFSIRQFALAAPAAVVVCAGLTDKPDRRSRYVALGLGELLACGLIYAWSSNIPGGLSQTITHPTWAAVIRVVQAYFTLAFFLSPAVALAAWARIRQFSYQAVAGIAVLFIGVIVAWHYYGVFLGNYLVQQGFQGQALLDGGRGPLIPGYLWVVMTAVACASGGTLAWLGATGLRSTRTWRSRNWSDPLALLSMFGFLMAAGLTVYGIDSSSLFDRYMWPLVFPLAVVLLRIFHRRRVAASVRPIALLFVSLTGLLTFTTLALTVNADVYSSARWRAGQVAVHHGVKPADVDAGFEWVGAHATKAIIHPVEASAPVYVPDYALIEPRFRDCALVSALPIGPLFPHFQLIGVASYRQFGLVGQYQLLFVYVTNAADCPARG